MGCALSASDIKGAKAFHGHWCPGLALGIRVAELALREVGRSSDEEVVALVECDMCAVDALQYLVSCTFGKGNLIYRDYGKAVFSFWRRRDGKNLRISRKPYTMPEDPRVGQLNQEKQLRELSGEEKAVLRKHREEKCGFLMEASLEDLFYCGPAREPLPEKAVIEPSVPCSCCGELVMASRMRTLSSGASCCIPCFREYKEKEREPKR